MAEQAFPAQPQAFGAARVVATPFQFALGDDDNLQIVSANSLTGVVLAVQGRKLSSAGKIEPFAFVHTPNSDRSSKTENFKLGGGALLNLTIFASSGAPTIGQTFVIAKMIRGLAAATIVLGGLFAGYVTAAQPLAYPGSPILSSLDGGGYVRRITGTRPAAGVNCAETVPPGARWELVSFRTDLVTSGAAGSRLPYLYQSSGANQYFFMPALSTVAPSGAKTFVWADGLPLEAVIDPLNLVMGLVRGSPLLAGDTITTATNAFDAGDQYSAPNYTVREWLEVQS